MTTSFIDRRAPRRRAPAGFTLVEVLISAGIGSFVLIAVLTSFLFIGRSGAMLSNYVRLEQEARRGLERFGEDTRMASALTTSTNRVALTIPHASDSNTNTVTGGWETTAGSYYHCVMRREVDNTGTTLSTERVMPNVASFQYDRWVAGSTTGVQATSDALTDQLQIHLTLQLQASEFGVTSSAVAAATNLVVSAKFILRNKT